MHVFSVSYFVRDNVGHETPGEKIIIASDAAAAVSMLVKKWPSFWTNNPDTSDTMKVWGVKCIVADVAWIAE